MNVNISLNGIVECPLCFSNINENNYEETYYSELVAQTYKRYVCKNCSLEFWNPMYIEKKIYEEELQTEYILFHFGLSGISPMMTPFLQDPPIKSGKLLDIGCGDGAFLEQAKKYGFDIWGIDLDNKSIKMANIKRKIDNVYNMTLHDFLDFALKRNLKFQIITFFEVLEHQDNLSCFINDIKSILVPNGIIVGSVPNNNRMLLKKDEGDYPPHHFTRWSKKTIERYLGDNSFEDITIKSCSLIPITNISDQLAEIILGNKFNEMIFWIRKKITGSVKLSHLSLSQIETIGAIKNIWKKKLARILIFTNKILKLTQRIIFLPLALLILIFQYNQRYKSLYFHGKNMPKKLIQKKVVKYFLCY